ncbi:MAG: universal stress protein [Pontibacterium sp.]
MSGIKRMLVYVDQNADNTRLLQKTRQLASGGDMQVELFCTAYSSALHQSYLFDKKAEEYAEHGYVKSVEAKLDNYAGELRVQGIACGVDVYWERHAIEGLVRKALRFEPDIVIYPLSHTHGFLDLITGDTNWKLIQQCPALLFLSHDRIWQWPPRIAACVDPFHNCEQPEELDHEVLVTTRQLSEQYRAEMEVVHCFHTLPQSAIFDEHVVTDYKALQQQVRQKHKAELDQLLASYNLSLSNPLVHLLEGEAHKLLPAYVKEREVDLLVMGQVPRGLLDHLLTGSTIERVLSELDADVLVVKPPGFVCPAEDT